MDTYPFQPLEGEIFEIKKYNIWQYSRRNDLAKPYLKSHLFEIKMQ